jgi:hypothetical protein
LIKHQTPNKKPNNQPPKPNKHKKKPTRHNTQRPQTNQANAEHEEVWQDLKTTTTM